MAITNDMVTGFDTSTVGDKTLKIVYKNKEVKVNYSVDYSSSNVELMLEQVNNKCNGETVVKNGNLYKAVISNMTYYFDLQNNVAIRVDDANNQETVTNFEGTY